MDAAGSADELRALRWRCRRGMKELDLKLVGYLERCYPGADGAEQAAFRRLLEVQDPELWGWLLGRARPQDPQLEGLIQRIRDLPLGGAGG